MSIDSEQARMYVAATVYYHPKLMDARLHNMPHTHSNERTESTQQMSRTQYFMQHTQKKQFKFCNIEHLEQNVTKHIFIYRKQMTTTNILRTAKPSSTGRRLFYGLIVYSVCMVGFFIASRVVNLALLEIFCLLVHIDVNTSYQHQGSQIIFTEQRYRRYSAYFLRQINFKILKVKALIVKIKITHFQL